MIASGPLSSKIWIIGETPEPDDARDGAFSNTEGRYLRDKLMTYGFDPTQIRYEFLSDIRPPKNDFDWFYQREDRKEKLATYVAELKARIIENKPNICLLLGERVLQILGDKKDINTWRGHVITILGGIKALASYRPTNIMRQRYVEKAQHPGQYDALFSLDMQKLYEEFPTSTLNYFQYQLIIEPTYNQIMKYLEEVKQNAKILSYDIETVGNCLVDCIGLSFELGRGICIPLYDPSGTKRYFTNTETNQIIRTLKSILESDIPKVAQNSQYDDVILAEYYKIHNRNLIWDTMVAMQDIYSELPKDLGTLISIFTKLPMHKHLGKSKSARDHWTYNAADAVANLHIMQGQVVSCKEYGIEDHYRCVVHPVIRVLREMQLRGTNVNLEFRKDSISQLNYLQNEIMEIFNKIFPEPLVPAKKKLYKYNPRSSKDKAKLFLDKLGCKPIYRDSNLTLDKHAMDKYAEDKRPYVSLLAKASKKYALAGAMKGKLETPLKNGRMHCAYSIGGIDTSGDEIGTDTGRLASRESLFGTGTNLQNLKKGPQRQMLIPDEGCGFVISDLWAAEAYLTALDANEPTLLGMLQKGIKVHSWMLEETKSKFPTEVAKSGYDYKKAKITVHGADYGVAAHKLTQETGLPDYVCEWQLALFHEKFPGIRMRMARIRNKVEGTRILKSFLGRHKIFVAPLGYELYHQANAWPSQSTIGELTLIGMVKIYYSGLCGHTYIFPTLNTHDGLVCQFKLGSETQAGKIVRDAFEIPVTANGITICIPCEYGYANNFNDFIKEPEVVWYQAKT